MLIKKFILKSNGRFSILKDVYDKNQHPNQQEGLNKYVDVLDHCTGNVNSVKLYMNNKGMHFKKNGTWYLADFTKKNLYIPFQIIEVHES